jgi:hypothetical protein
MVEHNPERETATNKGFSMPDEEAADGVSRQLVLNHSPASPLQLQT